MRDNSQQSAVLALVEGTREDIRVLQSARSGARPGQRIVMLRVLPLVERSLPRGPLAGGRIEPWERMEAQERTALAAMRELGGKLISWRPAEALVRFGDRIEQTAAVAGAVGAARLVATSTPQNRRLAEVLSPRLEIPTLLVSEELPKPDPKPAALANVPAFKALSRSARRRLARHLDPVSVKAGATLLREGRRNQTFWVILAGEVELTVRGMKARRFGAGDLLGATSMLDGVGATGTAVALTDIEALVAGPEDFRALEADPEIEAKLEAASRAVLRSEVLALRAAA